MAEHLTTPETRRTFLKNLAIAAGGAVLLPLATSCTGGSGKTGGKTAGKTGATKTGAEGDAKAPAVPETKPEGWDPIAYNKERGNAGKIPESYLPSINGPDGEKKHLGKHLPYVPEVADGMVPAGFLALMWGDPDKGYAQHPNAPKSESNAEGHWYNWIEVRKAEEGEAPAAKSEYPVWPPTPETEKKYLVHGEAKEITADKGIHTVYLAKLPEGVKAGDTVRIWAHCLTHGEYVDFLTL